MKAEFKYTSDGGVAWYRLTDVVRSTIVYETISDMYGGALAALSRFRGRVREYNDRYMHPMDGGYRDLKFLVAYGDDDFICELQMSTQVMTDAKMTSGHRTYDVHRELVAAVADGDMERCETILLWGSELFPELRQLGQVVNATQADQGTLLHEAARQGNPDLIRLLLVYEAEVDARDSHGSTPLHMVMAAGHKRAMWALVDVGKADIKAPDAQGLEPLLHGYLALRSHPDHEKVVRTVCALAQCAGREHAKAMRERIDGEVQKRWRRSAALVSAAADGDEDRVRTELINYAHPDSADSTSVTALDAALNGNHPRVASLLLAAGSNPRKTRYFTELQTLFGHFEFIQGAAEGGIKYSDICAGPDGLLYCSPFNASSVLVIDPCARTLSFIEGAEEGGLKYFGICAGPDGML